MSREQLPQRRMHLHFDHEWPAASLRPFKVNIGVGFYTDGRLGEAFLVAGQSGESLEANARDGAILFSLAMQYGASLDEIRNAITREETGEASSMLGSCIDRIATELAAIERRPDADPVSPAPNDPPPAPLSDANTLETSDEAR